jgi:hypothetical protein
MAWELRGAWGSGQDVRLTLTKRCMLRTVVGRVSRVSTTGAFAIVDGWHIPCAEVRGTGKPTIEDRDRYARQLARLRKQGKIE